MAFWHVVAGVALMLAGGAWGLAQHRWTERMLKQLNQNRPPHDRLQPWGNGPFKSLEIREQIRRAYPDEYRAAMLRFGISGFILFGLMVLLWVGSG